MKSEEPIIGVCVECLDLWCRTEIFYVFEQSRVKVITMSQLEGGGSGSQTQLLRLLKDSAKSGPLGIRKFPFVPPLLLSSLSRQQSRWLHMCPPSPHPRIPQPHPVKKPRIL